MTDWQPIETAPKDGTVVLVYQPDGVEVDDHTYTWPKGYMLAVVPARWHEPNRRTREDAGWYAPWFWLDFGVYDDPSTEMDPASLDPTHWMPLPAPPSDASK